MKKDVMAETLDELVKIEVKFMGSPIYVPILSRSCNLFKVMYLLTANMRSKKVSWQNYWTFDVPQF